MKTLVGIVGHTPVIDQWPLGPRLLARLEAMLADRTDIAVEPMSWGPIHTVQRFEEDGAERYDRLVLVGAAARSVRPGEVTVYRWEGGSLPDAVMQERIYEGITGIVDIENTLVIGHHFGIWPAECYTVEADLPADSFGRMVIAGSEGWGSEDELARHLGFSPHAVTEMLADRAAALARDGAAAGVPLAGKTADSFAPVGSFLHNHTVAAGGER